MNRTNRCATLLLLARFLCCCAVATEEPPVLSIDFPASRLVFQRDLKNGATIPIRGKCSASGAEVEVRFFEANASPESSEWQRLETVRSDGTFSGTQKVPAGWYSMELRSRADEKTIATARVERVGVGEVFIIMGHSVAQGGDLNLPGPDDDRVETIPLNDELQRKYEQTGDPRDLPPLLGSRFSSDVKPAPFGHGTYFWAAFAQELVRKENVPVLILNAAFGGTSLEHWAKSARGESFEHGFVRSKIRMPYVNLKNALQKYAKVLGVRAVLSDQGQNDAPEDRANVIFDNYITVIAQARLDLGFPNLAFVINRQTPYLTKKQVRQVQQRVIHQFRGCFEGPDYDFLKPADRPDGIHLGVSGMEKAAQAWSDAVSANFLKTVTPFIPTKSN